MAHDIKVSVIIPVYNAERYLHQCIESVINQTLKDIEIICVDDGSTDNSCEILYEYCRRDNRIQIIHQKNQYAGIARNTGKSNAKGKYLVFWDADDYFDLNALEKMYLKCEADKADVCVCNGKQYLEDLQIEYLPNTYVRKARLPEELPFNIHTHQDYILNFTTESPWNKMFRREFIESNKLDFQGVRNGNDVYFVVNTICLADRITIVNEPLVCYRKNQVDSVQGTLFKSPLTPIKAWIDAGDNLKEKGAFPQKSFMNKALDSVYHSLHNITKWDAFKECVLFLKEEGLQRLYIELLEPEEYYVSWHREALIRLLEDSPEDFAVYLQNLSFKQQVNATAQKRITEDNSKKKIKKLNKKIIKQEKTFFDEQKNMQEEIENLRKEVEESTDMIDKLESERTTLVGKIDLLNSDNIKLKKEIKKLTIKIGDIYNSATWRVGRIIVWLPGKLKNLFNMNKQ